MSGQTPGLRGSYRADAGTGYRCKYCDLQRRECNPDTAILTGGDAPEQLTIQDVTPNLFSILAVDAKLVQETLGHSSYRLRMDTYSHMIPALRGGESYG